MEWLVRRRPGRRPGRIAVAMAAALLVVALSARGAWGAGSPVRPAAAPSAQVADAVAPGFRKGRVIPIRP